MPEDSVFEPMESAQGTQDPHARGEPRTSARDIASQAAAEAVRGGESEGPATGSRDRPLRSPESDFVRAEPMDREVQQTQEGQTAEDQDSERVEGEQQTQETGEPEPRGWEPEPVELTEDDFAELEELGIDLPMGPSDVPEGLQGAYAEIVQEIADQARTLRDREGQARQIAQRMQQFQERLQDPEGQKRVLLGLASQNPETFGEVTEMIERMQQDPEYAEMVRTRLEAEARMEAAQRREAALTQQQRDAKARRIESRTRRMARKHGVPEKFANEAVVNRILQNQQRTGEPDITTQEVDQVIQSLGKELGPRRPQRAKSPETAQKEQQAPTQSTEGAGQPASETGEARNPRQTSGGAERSSDVMDRLRTAVKQSYRDARSKGL